VPGLAVPLKGFEDARMATSVPAVLTESARLVR
jgi:hypothetical protein